MAGGGVTESNVGDLVAMTGVQAVHASLRREFMGSMEFKKEDVFMGGEKKNEGIKTEYGFKAADKERIEAVVKALQRRNGTPAK
jgi:copper homeostasis protein CutC